MYTLKKEWENTFFTFSSDVLKHKFPLSRVKGTKVLIRTFTAPKKSSFEVWCVTHAARARHLATFPGDKSDDNRAFNTAWTYADWIFETANHPVVVFTEKGGMKQYLE
jgi:hypothetical protein